jgi:hypothetical protein
MRADPVLAELDLGDHLCVPVSDVADRIGIAAAVTGAALRAGDRAIIFTDHPGAAAMAGLLSARVPGAAAALTRDQLRVQPSSASYLPDGQFRPEPVGAYFAAEIDRAVREGYGGLRVAADLGWAGRPDIDRDALIGYEVGTNALCPAARAMGVCMYDRRALPREVWLRLVAAHPTAVATPGGPAVSRLRCLRTDAPPGLRLEGEVDLVNYAALPILLDAAVPLPGECVVDTVGLRFADVYALACLLQVAIRREGRPTRLVCRANVARVLRLIDADGIPDLTITETA